MSEQAVFDALRYRIEVDMRGTRWYYNAADQLHRDEGPAIEYANGGKRWYQNDQYHRTDGPAVEYADGTKFWYHNGQLHRINGPAVVDSNGHMEWHINGVRLSEADFNQAVKLL